jgi:hypothetical protein
MRTAMRKVPFRPGSADQTTPSRGRIKIDHNVIDHNVNG